jgi:hypothetical protein
VVKTLYRRAQDVSSSTESLKEEQKVLQHAFKNCGYPEWAIRAGISDPETQIPKDNPEKKGFMCIPYIKGVTEPVSRVIRSAGLDVAMKPIRTLRQSLVRPKDPIKPEDRPGVVYMIECNSCDAQYVGQTGRNLKERIKEHEKSTNKGEILKSGIAEHAHTTGHSINWEAKVLDQDQVKTRRLVKESIHIKLNNPTMNRDQGLEVDKCLINVCKSKPVPNPDVLPGKSAEPSGGESLTPHQLPM